MKFTQPGTLILSKHAEWRASQRAIPAAILEALLAVGVRDFDHRSGIRVHVHNHRSKQKFFQLVGRQIGEHFADCYCVLDSTRRTEVITVGWMNVPRVVDVDPPHRIVARRRE